MHFLIETKEQLDNARIAEGFCHVCNSELVDEWNESGNFKFRTCSKTDMHYCKLLETKKTN